MKYLILCLCFLIAGCNSSVTVHDKTLKDLQARCNKNDGIKKINFISTHIDRLITDAEVYCKDSAVFYYTTAKNDAEKEH